MTTSNRYADGGVTHRVYERTFDEDESATDEESGGPCHECDGTVITNAAETICADCGLVIASQPVDLGPEWRCADDPDRNPRRTGSPRTVTRHDFGHSTKIGRNRDGNGQALSSRKRTQLGRLRREHRRGRFRSKAERNLAHGLSDIKRLSDRIESSQATRDRACVLFRRAHGDGLCRGRSIEMLASGACYAACRERTEFRTLDEVAGASTCDRSQVRHGYQVLQVEYDLAAPPFPLRVHVGRLISRFDLAPSATERAVELADIATEIGLPNGRNRSGVAAACLYQTTREHPPKRGQSACADAAGTTTATLRNRWHELRDAIE